MNCSVSNFSIFSILQPDMGVSNANDRELIGKVHSAMYQQCRKRGYAAPVDVLMDIGVLSK